MLPRRVPRCERNSDERENAGARLRPPRYKLPSMRVRLRVQAGWWIALASLVVATGCSGVSRVPSRGLQRGAAPAPVVGSAAPGPTVAGPTVVGPAVGSAVAGPTDVEPTIGSTSAPAADETVAGTPARSESASAPAPAPVARPNAPAVADAAPASAAAAGGEPGRGAEAGRDQPLAVAAAGEAELREQLATAADPTPAATALVARLADEERHDEALAVVSTARQRSDSPLLVVLQASVLRDLGQRHAALAELLQLRSRLGDAGFSPGLLLEVAELQWLEGHKPEASATLSAVRQLAGDTLTSALRSDLDRLTAEVASSAAPRTIRARDLLGNLRGAPSATARLDALARLMKEQAEPQLRERAVMIAAGDDASSVRARAVQLANPAERDRDEFCRIALTDPAPLVRRFAIGRTVELLGPAAAALLVGRLEVETDAGVCEALDAALCRIVPGQSPDPAAGGDAAARAGVVARWRRLLEGR